MASFERRPRTTTAVGPVVAAGGAAAGAPTPRNGSPCSCGEKTRSRWHNTPRTARCTNPSRSKCRTSTIDRAACRWRTTTTSTSLDPRADGRPLVPRRRRRRPPRRGRERSNDGCILIFLTWCSTVTLSGPAKTTNE